MNHLFISKFRVALFYFYYFYNNIIKIIIIFRFYYFIIFRLQFLKSLVVEEFNELSNL